VEGGIIGKDKGHCTAGGSITCRYISNATLIAGGNISCHGEVAHARIVCGGRLTVERGPLVSGHVTANGGVSCRSLGSPANAKILLEAGFDEKFRGVKATLDEITARRKNAAHIREVVARIMQHSRKLMPGQQQEVTKAVAKADEAEKSANEMLQSLRELYEASRRNSVGEIVEQEILHAGVTVRFCGVEGTIESDFKGPLSLVPRQHEGEWKLFLIDGRSKSTHELPSHPWHDSVIDAIRKAVEAA